MPEPSAKEIWEAAKGALQIEVSRPNYNTWLKDTIGISYYRNQFVVGTPSIFAVEWLEKCLCSLVKKTLISITKQDVEVQFQVHPKREEPPLPNLKPNYTFNTFIPGSCNRLAYAAAMGVAETPGQSYNPLFIYSGAGMGKTHLMHAIGNAAFYNGFRVIYTSSEHFTNEFINAIKERKTGAFRDKYRTADILLIDDIYFISGKEQTQDGFFHIFNDLYNANRQIVITCDRHPKAMSLMEHRLRSRFEGGLITDIQTPSLETRMAILRAKAKQQQANINEKVFQFIALQCQRSIRELEGSLNLLVAFSKLNREPPTLQLAEQVLGRIIADDPCQNITPNTILNAVSKYFNISLESLKGKRRDRQTSLARQVAIYLIREESHYPLEKIGEMLGRRDHSTILHSYHKLSQLVEADPELLNKVNEIKGRLYNKPCG